MSAPPDLLKTAPPPRGWREWLLAPVDIASLVYFRIAFGAIMLWEVWRYFHYDRIERYFVEPAFRFTYYGFDWVKPWPGDGMYLHFFVMGVLALCILVGFCYRVSAALFFVAWTYQFLLDVAQYLNHFYLVSLFSFLLIFAPANRAFSVDAWLRPGIRSDTAPTWSLGMLVAQMSIAYFYAGVAKLNGDWLQGEPVRMWLAAVADHPWLGPYLTREWAVYLVAYGGLIFDLAVVPLLLWKRTRLLVFGAALFFHLMNNQLFSIGIFPFFSIAATLLFFPPDWPRRLSGRFTGRTGAAVVPATRNTPLSGGQRIVAGLLTVYFAWQVLMPLRHFLYPGDVSWTEEGHNFSWHMKLRDKEAKAVFVVNTPDRRLVSNVDPAQYLTDRQVRKMSSRPDLILQFAHILAGRLRQAGHGEVEVRAHVLASLNGRKPQYLIDPAVNLAVQPRNLWPKPWIMPLTEPLQPTAARGRAIEGSDPD